MNDMPSCCNSKTRKSRKEHKCFGCGSVIHKSDEYLYTSGVWEGEPNSFKHCKSCEKILCDFRRIDSNLSEDEGPALNMYGVRHFMQGFLCQNWSNEKAVSEITSIFDVSREYASLILGYEDDEAKR